MSLVICHLVSWVEEEEGQVETSEEQQAAAELNKSQSNLLSIPRTALLQMQSKDTETGQQVMQHTKGRLYCAITPETQIGISAAITGNEQPTQCR